MVKQKQSLNKTNWFKEITFWVGVACYFFALMLFVYKCCEFFGSHSFIETDKYMLKEDCEAEVQSYDRKIVLENAIFCREQAAEMAKRSLNDCDYYYFFCTGYDNPGDKPCDYVQLTSRRDIEGIRKFASEPMAANRVFKIYKCGKFVESIKSNNYMRRRRD